MPDDHSLPHAVRPHWPRQSMLESLAFQPQQDVAAEQPNALWLYLHLPQFLLEIAMRGSNERRPCVLVETQGTRQRVLVANSQAMTLGVCADMPLTAAHALGELKVLTRDPSAEDRALAQLAAWAYQFTSLVSPVAPDGMLLEIKGSLALFGGIDGLLRRVRRELGTLGYRAYLAVATTPLAATLLARAQRQLLVVSSQKLHGALSPLPLDVLRLPSAQLQDLQRMGVRSLGDCLRLPRGGLGRRLSPELLGMLDRMLGQAADPRSYFILPKVFESRLELPWEVQHAQALSIAAERLLHELVGYLRAHCAGTRHLRWTLSHPDDTLTHCQVELTTPSREHGRLALLSRERLSRLVLRAPVRGLSLSVDTLVAEARKPAADLFKHRISGREEEWPQFIERLRARLGEQALRGLSLVADHRPERAWQWREPWTKPNTGHGPAAPNVARTARRPLWLTRHPLPLSEHDGQPTWSGPLRLSAERERIESGWWDGGDIRRDYFIATDANGARLWVFRELTGKRGWYLHGIFD